MKNIEKLKKNLIKEFAKKYRNKDVDKLTIRELKKISETAEWWAYVHTAVPDGFGKYSIFDFNGYAIDKKDNSKTHAISKKVAAIAKDKICMYCWGMRWKDIHKKKEEDLDSINVFLKNKSIMDKRREFGNNVVVHGQSDTPIGRTMVASIIMREAIRLRISKCTIGDTYDWVDYSKLFDAIKQDSMDSRSLGSMALAYYKSCDWLVIDNIEKKSRSDKQTTLVSDLVDPFFWDRYNNQQPTILVCKFDIRDRMFDLEKTFGVSFGRIINSKKTFNIPLSEDLLSYYND